MSLGWGQGPCYPSEEQPGCLLFSRTPIALRVGSLCGLAWSLPCPESVSILAADGMVTVAGVDAVCSPGCSMPPLMTFPLWVTCERVAGRGGGQGAAPSSSGSHASDVWTPAGQGFGLLRVWGSSLRVCSCCLFRCQHSADAGFELLETN